MFDTSVVKKSHIMGLWRSKNACDVEALNRCYAESVKPFKNMQKIAWGMIVVACALVLIFPFGKWVVVPMVIVSLLARYVASKNIDVFDGAHAEYEEMIEKKRLPPNMDAP